MMRVAFISTMEGVPWGGSEVLWSRAANRLARSGVQVGVSAWRWPELAKPIRDLQELGCRVVLRSPPSLHTQALRRLGWNCQSAHGWLRRFRPELVVISLGIHTEGAEAAAACRRFGLPYALVVQSADEARWPADHDLDRLAVAYHGAVRCYFVSENNQRLVETQLAEELPNARIIRNPFNLRYDAAPPWPDDRGITRFACVAQLAPVQKSQDLLFQVLREEKWRKREIHLSLYGNGQNAQSLRRLADYYGLKRVRFCGYATDVEVVWADHHALLLPSRHEGMPLALIEAMLCGRVCVATDLAGNSELIEDNVTGFLAKAPTVSLVAEAMERAWARRSEWPQIGWRAAEAVRRLIPADPTGAFLDDLQTLV
jgi:glycosyltransferase involved in cell wall biosynthesis